MTAIGDAYPSHSHPYGIYVVLATRGGDAQLWVVADTAEKALAEVMRRLPSDWLITLTGETLTESEAELLDIQPNEARRLKEVRSHYKAGDLRLL